MEAGRALPGHGWPVGAVPRRAREAQGTGGQLYRPPAACRGAPFLLV